MIHLLGEMQLLPMLLPGRFIGSLEERRTLPLWAYGLLYAFILIIFFYYSINPAYVPDDIDFILLRKNFEQITKQGRWAQFLVTAHLLEGNPIPALSVILGAGFVITSSAVAAHILGIRRALSAFTFILLSSVSVYYGALFDFDQVRMTYPLANLFAVYGLYRVLRGQVYSGTLLISLGPAFYPASIGLLSVIVICYAIKNLLEMQGLKGLKSILRPVLAIALALLLYFLMSHLLSWLFGFSLGGKASLRLISKEKLMAAWDYIQLHSGFPVFDKHYWQYAPAMLWMQTAMFLGFACYASRQALYDSRAKFFSLWILIIAIYFAPFSLLWISKEVWYPPRSLYGYAILNAFWAAMLLEKILSLAPEVRWRNPMASLASGLAFFLLLCHAVQINKSAFDSYLATQSDIEATQDILSRIEETLAKAGDGRTENIPIAVIYNGPGGLTGPRGTVISARHEKWTREAIFNLLDRRFYPASDEQMAEAIRAATAHEEWPASDSVFLAGQTMIVLLQK